jgi:hypothetical protein
MINLRPFSRNKKWKKSSDGKFFELFFSPKKCNVQSLTSINDLEAPGEIFERSDLQVCVFIISNYTVALCPILCGSLGFHIRVATVQWL